MFWGVPAKIPCYIWPMQKKQPSIDLQQCAAFQKLSVKHQKFILEYLKALNAGAAYGQIYHTKPKVSASNGDRLLRKADIRAAIAAVQGLLNQPDIANLQELRERWTLQSRSAITDVVTWSKDGLVFIDDSDTIPREIAQNIRKVKVTTRVSAKGDWTETEVNVEMYDRNKGEELLGRSRGDFIDKQEVAGPNGGPIIFRVIYDDKAIKNVAK